MNSKTKCVIQPLLAATGQSNLPGDLKRFQTKFIKVHRDLFSSSIWYTHWQELAKPKKVNNWQSILVFPFCRQSSQKWADHFRGRHRPFLHWLQPKFCIYVCLALFCFGHSKLESILSSLGFLPIIICPPAEDKRQVSLLHSQSCTYFKQVTAGHNN